MTKIDGKYKQILTENLKSQIDQTDSTAERHYLLAKYLEQRCLQIENILANIEDDDIDTTLVIEQLWEDLYAACQQIRFTINRVDSYAYKHKLEKYDSEFDRYKLSPMTDRQKGELLFMIITIFLLSLMFIPLFWH